VEINSFFKEDKSMTILNCSATTCVYNENELCAKGEIEIGGSCAHQADETCCSSFQERTSSGMKNSYKEDCGCEKIQIKCDAKDCIYNDSYKCEAASIDIEGSGACNCQETKCGTFQCQG
jgi:hypothetical protein